MAGSAERGDLLAAGLRFRPLREPSVSETSEDAIWVAAARAGDRAAFGHLTRDTLAWSTEFCSRRSRSAMWTTLFRMFSSGCSDVCQRCVKTETSERGS